MDRVSQGISSLFQGRLWFWFHDCVIHIFFLASLKYLYDFEGFIIDHNIYKWDIGMINSMNYDFIVCFWGYTCDSDCHLLNGWDVAFRQTNLDRFSCFGINMGSVAMFCHKQWIRYTTFRHANCLSFFYERTNE